VLTRTSLLLLLVVGESTAISAQKGSEPTPAIEVHANCLHSAERNLYRFELEKEPAFPILGMTDEAIFPYLLAQCDATRRAVLAAGSETALLTEREQQVKTFALSRAKSRRPKLLEIEAQIRTPGPRPPVAVITPRADQYDFPSLKAGESLSVVASFDVGIDGRAINCTTPGPATAFTTRVCKIIETRARYAPAIDTKGSMIIGSRDLAFTLRSSE
jgi:hypothetical protein